MSGKKKQRMGFLPQADEYYDDFEHLLNTLDPAWAKAALFFRTHNRFGHGDNIRMMSLEDVHKHLNVFKRRFERGDTMALLHAIKSCAEENLTLPTWLAVAYSDALTSFLQPGGAPSLDDVFHSRNLPTDTPKKAAIARQDWAMGGALWHKAWELAQRDESIQSFHALVKRLLEEGNFGVSLTKAKELIEMVEHNQIEFLGNQSLSRFLDIRRKQSKPG